MNNDNTNLLPEEDELDPVLVLTDDEGNDVTFAFLDLIEYEGGMYVVLLPEEDDDVVILRVEETEEGESYSGVESEELLHTLFELFKERFAAAFEGEAE